MHLRAKDTLQLILHWGAKSKREPPGASIELQVLQLSTQSTVVPIASSVRTLDQTPEGELYTWR